LRRQVEQRNPTYKLQLLPLVIRASFAKDLYVHSVMIAQDDKLQKLTKNASNKKWLVFPAIFP
jgi:hypothetical protein